MGSNSLNEIGEIIGSAQGGFSLTTPDGNASRDTILRSSTKSTLREKIYFDASKTWTGENI